jgi:hypothetical protein
MTEWDPAAGAARETTVFLRLTILPHDPFSRFPCIEPAIHLKKSKIL